MFLTILRRLGHSALIVFMLFFAAMACRPAMAQSVDSFAGSIQGSLDGTGSGAKFDVPSGIARLNTNLYVADTYSSQIRKVSIANASVTTLAGGSPGSSDGNGLAASFLSPRGVTADISNNQLFVADTGNHTIRLIELVNGDVTTLAGSAGLTGSADGPSGTARFNSPYALVYVLVDGNRNIYVADHDNCLIRKVDAGDGTTTTVAGNGSCVYSDGVGIAASFKAPTAITVNSTKTALYVADGDRIRVIQLSDFSVSTLAGSTAGFADGVGAAAKFNAPEGLAFDGQGDLLISDTGNQRIRRLVLSGATVSTVAGDGVAAAGDGFGGAAHFSSPKGLVAAGSTIYIADSGNYQLRRITPPVVFLDAGFSGLTATSINLPMICTNDSSVTGYWVVQDMGLGEVPLPSESQLLLGKDANNQTAVASGSLAMTCDASNEIVVNDLDPGALRVLSACCRCGGRTLSRISLSVVHNAA